MKQPENHNCSKTVEYKAWQNMKDRCYNPHYQHYSRYGGRGITVCEKWLNSFKAFLLDVGHRPSSTHSLDRINNNGHYEPTNVKWSTHIEQHNNDSRVRRIEFN